MSDKISKALAQFSLQDKQLINQLLLLIKRNDLIGLDVSRLKGHKDIYRLRKGRIRIIYQAKNGQINILEIGRRSEKTYRNY